MALRRVLWTIALCSGFGVPCSADIYQCENADGSLHFTNSKPNTKRCRRVVRETTKTQTPKRANSGSPKARDRKPARTGDAFSQTIDQAAALYRLPRELIRAVMKTESNYNPSVVSHAGAMGLMQLMPRTAKSMGVEDPYDPQQSILGGARYLRILANRFKGDIVLTIAAYNAGEGAVEKYGGIPPYKETQRYVRRVLGRYYAYRAERMPDAIR